MQIRYSLLLFLSFVCVVKSRSVVEFADEDTQITREYCGNFAQCRSVAKKQLETCVGGFTEMFIMQSSKFTDFKASDKSIKCEKELVETIENEIKPFYEKIEEETFSCAAKADVNAFNLDQSQKIKCKLIQSEVRPDSFAITGTRNNDECKEAYDSQLRRCDLLKECCPQYNHCRVKSEVQNQAFGKEEKLAAQFDNCIKRQDIDFHESPKTTTEAVPPAPEAESEEIDTETHTTTIEKRRAPERAPIAHSTATPTTPVIKIETPATLPTIPPPEKVFNDLVGFLFPGLTTTLPAPTTTKPETTTISLARIQAEQDAQAKKQAFLKKFQFGEYAKTQEKAKLFDALDDKTKKELKKGTEASSNSEVEKVVPAKQEKEKPTHAATHSLKSSEKKTHDTHKAKLSALTARNAHKANIISKSEFLSRSPRPASTSSTSAPTESTFESTSPPTEESAEEDVTESAAQSTTTHSPVTARPRQFDSHSSFSVDPKPHSFHRSTTPSFQVPVSEKNTLSKMFCEQYLECQQIVEKQYKICDTNYLPEAHLYGIKDYALRQQFLNNSNVEEEGVKHKCTESVDPESQRQLIMLRTLVKQQVDNCTRNLPVPLIGAHLLDQCKNLQLLTMVSELFTQNSIPSTKTLENGQKCYQRVRQLEEQCKIVSHCCPQNHFCSSSNRRAEATKYKDITEQLKEEQQLCEKRRMRILNGLV